MSRPLEQERQLLLVAGDDTFLINVNNTSRVSTTDFFSRVQVPKDNVSTGILPENTKLLVRSNGLSTYLLEYPPQKWLVSHQSEPAIYFEIAVPWICLLVKVRPDGKSFYAPSLLFNHKPIESLEDHLYYSFLPNQYDNNATCPGHEYDNVMLGTGAQASIPLSRRIGDAYTYFKNSAFNEDLRPVAIPATINDMRAVEGIPEFIRTRFASDSRNKKLVAKIAAFTLGAGANALGEICRIVRTEGTPFSTVRGLVSGAN